MTSLPAYGEITLALGGNTVRLRPSLRAAAHLERLHDGFPTLLRHIADFNLGTIREIILIAATDRREATAFLAQIDSTPLKIFADAVVAPILTLCGAFIPAPDPDAKPDPKAKPMAWPEVYRQLFRTATGWLGWTPEAAWNATVAEINDSFAGHIAKLKAIHGSSDKDDTDKQPDTYSAERLQEIEDKGFDPAFDRKGLHALKARLAGGS